MGMAAFSRNTITQTPADNSADWQYPYAARRKGEHPCKPTNHRRCRQRQASAARPSRRRIFLPSARVRPRYVIMAYAKKYNVNVVGDRIRLLREELGLTREEVAKHVPELTVEHLCCIEESVDRLSNPTLIQLREIATILKTTVADLVEPDLNERLLTQLSQWVSQDRTAARFRGITLRDRNKILRRLLLRLIDSLEVES